VQLEEGTEDTKQYVELLVPLKVYKQSEFEDRFPQIAKSIHSRPACFGLTFLSRAPVEAIYQFSRGLYKVM
jgi:hypothetical protein